MNMPVTAHSVAEPSSRSKLIASVLVVTYAVITILPLLWIFLTGFKTPPDSIAYPPRILYRAFGRRLRQPVYNALAANAGIPGQPAAAADLV